MLVSIEDFSSQWKFSTCHLTKGGPSIIINSNGLYNMTKFFEYYSANVDRWMCLSKTKEFLKKCEKLFPDTVFLMEETNKKYAGVYVCSFIAIEAARWISTTAYFDFLALHENILVYSPKKTGKPKAQHKPSTKPVELHLVTPGEKLENVVDDEQYFRDLMLEIDILRSCMLH